MDSPSQVVQDFAGLMELGELFFFDAEFGGVGDQRAAGATGGVLHVEHFVVQDVFHGALGDVRAVHAAVEQDVAGTRVVAAELTAPALCTPTDVGPD
jgi:hypothetical protein